MLWLLSIYIICHCILERSHAAPPPPSTSSPPLHLSNSLPLLSNHLPHSLVVVTNNVLCIHGYFQGNTLYSLVKLSHVMDGALKQSPQLL